MKKKDDKNELHKWQERFDESKNEYSAELALMTERDNYYEGDKTIYTADRRKADKHAATTRNVVFELIESQVESSFPTPKVTPYREEDEDRAKEIEDMLRNEMDRLPFERINDTDERTTPIQGGDFFLIEWDSAQHTHTTLGEISVQLLHPRKVIPQKGAETLEQSDWVFLELAQTKEYIKRRYGIDVSEEGESNPEVRGNGKNNSDNMVTQVIVFYRNSEGGIGRFSWVNDVVLENLEDCQAPMQKYCPKCEVLFSANHDECPYCENKKLQDRAQEFVELEEDIVLYNEDGTERKRIPAYTQAYDEYGFPMEEQATDNNGFPMFDAVLDASGMPMIGADGLPQMVPRMQPMMEKTKIPVYKPNKFPLIMRKNVSVDGKFLGNSDVDFIRDQQNEINKYSTIIVEKAQSGGSLVVLPVDLPVDDTDQQMRLARVKDPNQAAQIHVYNLQADFSNDIQMMEMNYEIARQTIGITDSFQGRRDSTATSGKAKEFSAAQAAGRFESKRTMKRATYADLYEIMFQMMLAYADEPRTFKAVDKMGNDIYCRFNRWEFLEQDAAGEWYWNDRFMFSTDNTGNLSQNREALWQETRENFQAGTFGNPQELDTQILYWTMMKQQHYPIAGTILSNLKEKQQKIEEQMQAQMMAAQQQMAMTPPMRVFPPQEQPVM